MSRMGRRRVIVVWRRAMAGTAVAIRTNTGLLRALAVELFATGLFVMIGIGATASVIVGSSEASGVVDGLPGIALAHGVAYSLLVAAAAPVSGGYLNPAVTFAMMIVGRITLPRGLLYIAAQVAGACLGAALLRALLRDGLLLAIPGAAGHDVNNLVTDPVQGLFLEAIATFMLVWAFLGTVQRGGSPLAVPLLAGLVIIAAEFFLFPITGASLNPARTFGPALVNNRWDDHWVFWLGPLLGASVSAICCYLLFLAPSSPLRGRTARAQGP